MRTFRSKPTQIIKTIINLKKSRKNQTVFQNLKNILEIYVLKIAQNQVPYKKKTNIASKYKHIAAHFSLLLRADKSFHVIMLVTFRIAHPINPSLQATS